MLRPLWIATGSLLLAAACGSVAPQLADAGRDAGSDAGEDAGVDAGSDAGADAGFDAGTDAGVDAGFDAGSDAGEDAGFDAGSDAGEDAGSDAGLDAGTWVVTPIGDSQETITPATAQTVPNHQTVSFTVTPDTGETVSTAVGGTCPPGQWAGDVYTTGAIAADCSVSFSASTSMFTVSSSGDQNLTVTPAAQSVAYGAGAGFDVVPDAGYVDSTVVGGDCPSGQWNGNTYTTGPIVADCAATFASLPLYQVTVSGTTLGFSPPGPVEVPSGETTAFTIAPPGSYPFTPLAGGTCPSGLWSGNTYTTGPITANCTLSFSACETCGSECLPLPIPQSAPYVDAGMVCATPCAVEAAPSFACGGCADVCSGGESCINGSCQCEPGMPTCIAPYPVPTCVGELPVCSFLVGDLDPITPWSYTFVEVDGYQDSTTLFFVQAPAVLADAGDFVPYIMGCSTAGTLNYPRNGVEGKAFNVQGEITDLATLDTALATVATCGDFADGPRGTLPPSELIAGNGYYLKFTPTPGTYGNAYQTVTILFGNTPLPGTQTFAVGVYIINILPASAPDLVLVDPVLESGVTLPVRAGLGNTLTVAFGDAGLPVPTGSTAPIFVDTTPGYTLSSTVGGTCPPGSWIGTEYSTGPAFSDCSVVFSAQCAAGDTCTPMFTDQIDGTTASPYFGEGGGTAFGPDTCAPDSVLVGISGSHGPNIEELEALCAPAPVIDGVTAGVGTAVVGADPVALAFHGTTPGTAFTAVCPANEVLTRVDGYYDATDQSAGGGPTQGVHQLSVYCSSLSSTNGVFQASPPALAATIASSDTLPNATSTAFSFTCPDAGAIGQISGRIGDWLDGIAFTCFEP